MSVEYLWKDGGSVDGGCPALYRADRAGAAGYIVQGRHLSTAERGALREVAADEDAVWVPANILDRLAGGAG
ncbi:hypothetical protein GCM10010123_12370 [Pilimelia anulata]|uniref:Uncharacterized protein n=1 Tax=Pilimelia anulata TaxID=53371 RepID=A0A8J3FBI9_9ACTN|nr:lipid A biosynthesis lauroyl acyltransferase [Pilimelia anulata]GGJ84241.1 hypothetical protein GCM10010123_12370 [Pilimelia anulata]